MGDYRFRGKRTENGEWAYFNQYGAYVDKDGKELIPKRFTRDCGYTVDPETVGQYINKKDTTGKEIYEGDYDIENGVYYIAQYQDGELGMITLEPGFDPDFDDCVSWHNFTVIGNANDNPELLGEGHRS